MEKNVIANTIVSALVVGLNKDVEVLKAENLELRTILNIPKEDPECTSSPWWVILIPKQILKPTLDNFANCVIGPFFSRESANNHLEKNRDKFGNKASVYCLSGSYSAEYSESLKRAEDFQNKNSEYLSEKTEQTPAPVVEKSGNVW